MKLAGVTVLLVSLLFAAQTEARKSYDGFKSYEIVPKTKAQMDVLKAFNGNPAYDFWSKPRLLNKKVVVMVNPWHQRYFERVLKKHGFDYSVLIGNVGKIAERDMQHKARSRFLGKISFDQFYRYGDIVDYANQLASDYPNLVKTQVIGTTSEGRDIVGLRISSGGNGSRPAVFLEAGIHAREWIAPAVALYILNQLVENYDSNKDLVDQVDWFVVPVTNPDGYEYTHTDDRFWRKNRYKVNAFCKGIDANRNFGYHYGESGASTNPCDETYRGTGAFSEKESSAIRDFGSTARGRIHLYIALHSYGPYILYPWGYDEILSDDWEDLDALAQEMNRAVTNAGGESFDIGNSAILLYPAAGGSDDWFKGGNDAKYAYTMELPGGGSGGFDPPPSMIKPVVTSVFEGIKVGGNLVASLGKKTK